MKNSKMDATNIGPNQSKCLDIIRELSVIGRSDAAPQINRLSPPLDSIIPFIRALKDLKLNYEGLISDIDEFMALAGFAKVHKQKALDSKKYRICFTDSVSRIYRRRLLDNSIKEEDFLSFCKILIEIQALVIKDKFGDLLLLEVYEKFKRGTFNEAYNDYNKIKNGIPSELFDFNETDKKLELEFVARSIISILKSEVTKEEGHSLAEQIVDNSKPGRNELSWNFIRRFVIENLNRIKFPSGIYKHLAEDLAQEIKTGVTSIDEDNLFLLIKKLINTDKIDLNCQKDIWSILCSYPKIIGKISASNIDIFNVIENAFPYDQLNSVIDHYTPSEKIFLIYLEKHLNKLSEINFDKLKTIYTQKKYFNCEMVIALFQAKKDGVRIEINDVLLNLLRRIVNRAFSYNDDKKTKIENLIFPKCISLEGRQRFPIIAQNMIFCEGKQNIRKSDGEKYIWCRNHKCFDRTDLIDRDEIGKNESYFFNLMNKEFQISKDQIFENTNFALCMGSFNRWNEIAERLVCGHDGTEGCGANLVFSRVIKGIPGWQAYATTFWHCSERKCNMSHEIIKISHCAGCRKIIDSRFDTIQCKRADNKKFYICLDCGYCCKEHRVSWHCPKCNSMALEPVDKYGDRYQCAKCRHKIKIPAQMKKMAIDNNSYIF